MSTLDGMPGLFESRKARAMSTDERLMRWICWAFVAFFLCAYLLPLAALLSKSLMTSDGLFAGTANFATYLATPALGSSITNSLVLALAVSTIRDRKSVV